MLGKDDRIEITVTVNGESQIVDVASSDLLIDVLREQLHLTGTKRSCDLQICGTCTVLVDGKAVSSCTTLAVETENREVRTVEGLADGETLHPLQQAFIDEFASQCGFCTPGFLMTAFALLDEVSRPTPEEVHRYLEGNVCRCGSYTNILNAIERAQPTTER